MNTALPDNEINKELKDRLHNMEIGSDTFKFYVSTTGSDKPSHYFLVVTQLNQPNRTKCGRGWINSTEIQVIVRTPKNTGSKVVLNQAVDGVLTELDDFSLPSATSFKVSESDVSIDNELSQEVGGQIIYTKILRLQSTIN